MSWTTAPAPGTRKGRLVCLTLDAEADALLRQMMQNKRGFGGFISALIKQEADRRVERLLTLRALSAHEQEQTKQ